MSGTCEGRDALDRRLDPRSSRPIAVGFSGGGDSLAALVLTLRWAKATGRTVLALTVDHGLHPDSGAWTADAGATARRLGADWRALRWIGDKPSTGIQARARDARHRLLAAAASAAGARALVLGHTADDRAETALMRRTSVASIGRLREWSPSPAWPEGRGLFLLRPLLNASRSALRDRLTAAGETWFDDPANADPRYARIRARRALAEGETATEDERDLDLSLWPHRLAWTEEEARLPQAAISAWNPGVRPALGVLVTCIGAAATPPRGREVHRLIDAIAAGRVATLAGCRIDARGDPVRFARAAPRAGQSPRTEPLSLARQRFESACGLYPDEAALP